MTDPVSVYKFQRDQGEAAENMAALLRSRGLDAVAGVMAFWIDVAVDDADYEKLRDLQRSEPELFGGS